MAVASATAFYADIAGHGDKGINRTHVRAAVHVALHTVTNPDGGRLNRRELLGKLANHIRRQTTNFRCPLYRDVVEQVLLKLRIPVREMIDELLVHAAGVHQMARHTQRQRTV